MAEARPNDENVASHEGTTDGVHNAGSGKFVVEDCVFGNGVEVDNNVCRKEVWSIEKGKVEDLEGEENGTVGGESVVDERTGSERMEAEGLAVGMIFKNLEEVEMLYQQFAWSKGFSIVRATCSKRKDGVLSHQTFGCHRGRKAQKNSDLQSRQARKTKRMCCKARVNVSRTECGRWKVNSVINEHNHELSPEESRFFRQRQAVHPYLRHRLEMNNIGGVRPSKTSRTSVVQAGGVDNLGCLANDCRNYIEESRRLRLSDGDADAMHNLLKTPPSLPLEDRVAIVTGSSRGIGKAIALQLASLGAKLVINYSSNKAQADAVACQINTSTSTTTTTTRAITVQANVSDPAHVKSLFDEAERVFGSHVHILVNSAGVLDDKYPSIARTSLEDFDHTFSVNTRGAFLCCKEAANRITKGGGGRIILLSSSMVGALRPGFGAYTASKAAVEAMVKILAKELKGTGITANCVAPGPVATEMYFAGKTKEQIQKNIDENPLGWLGEIEDIAPVVGFLATDSGAWVNGQVIRVNGGFV